MHYIGLPKPESGGTQEEDLSNQWKDKMILLFVLICNYKK